MVKSWAAVRIFKQNHQSNLMVVNLGNSTLWVLDGMGQGPEYADEHQKLIAHGFACPQKMQTSRNMIGGGQ